MLTANRGVLRGKTQQKLYSLEVVARIPLLYRRLFLTNLVNSGKSRKLPHLNGFQPGDNLPKGLQPIVLMRNIGAPGEIRTPDQVVRSHLLYPAELRVHKLSGDLFNGTVHLRCLPATRGGILWQFVVMALPPSVRWPALRLPGPSGRFSWAASLSILPSRIEGAIIQ